MKKRRIFRSGLTVWLLGVMAQPAMGQTDGTVELTSVGVVTENPRRDSLVLGTVAPGMVLEFVEVRGPWCLVQAPDGVVKWRRGWLHERYVAVLSMPKSEPDAAREQIALRTSVRGFGQVGGIRFTAADSFDAVTGSSWGVMYGGGVQVGFSNGLFFQGSYEQYKETGQRVLVLDNQIFDLGIDNTVKVTPIQFTGGYRQPADYGTIGYVGIGGGWYRFQEEAAFAEPGDNVDESKPGLHILGGVEFALTRWLWLGGEGQWAYVPEILGNDGISQAFEEDDLGGFTIRLKLSVGL